MWALMTGSRLREWRPVLDPNATRSSRLSPRRLSAICQQTARNSRTADGRERTKCLVRHGMDGFLHLKVATRVRIPLGVRHKGALRADAWLAGSY
jgi:hypothetical protein